MAKCKLIEIYNYENWSLWINGIRFLEVCDHYLISFRLSSQPGTNNTLRLIRKKITEENLNDCMQNTFSVERMKEYLSTQPVQGFIYYSEDKKPVGFLWIMFKGGVFFEQGARRCDKEKSRRHQMRTGSDG